MNCPVTPTTRPARASSIRLAALTLLIPACFSLRPTGAQAASGRRPQRAAAASRAQAPARRVALNSVPLPDGSGSLRLPAGWQISSAIKGMVSAAGPHGSVDLGIWVTAYTPEAAAQLYARPPVVAPYGDAVQALKAIIPTFLALDPNSRQHPFRWIRLIDRSPTPWPQGKAEFVHYEWEIQGKGRWQTVALVVMSPVGDGSFLFYASSVSSPSNRFAANLPVLQQIWSSWKVSDHVFQERLANALASMRETGRILREANASRQEAQDRSNQAWSHVTRGTWSYEDTQTGRRFDAPHDNMRQRLEQMNRDAGYERYKEVPYRELNR